MSLKICNNLVGDQNEEEEDQKALKNQGVQENLVADQNKMA